MKCKYFWNIKNILTTEDKQCLLLQRRFEIFIYNFYVKNSFQAILNSPPLLISAKPSMSRNILIYFLTLISFSHSVFRIHFYSSWKSIYHKIVFFWYHWYAYNMLNYFRSFLKACISNVLYSCFKRKYTFTLASFVQILDVN